jgi:hypothetical protein
MTATNFQSVKAQTEVQCMIWTQLQLNKAPIDIDNVQLIESQDEFQDSITLYTYNGLNDKLIWNQQITKFE